MYARLLPHFGESTVVIVVVKEVVAAEIRDIKIDEAVIIVIGCNYTLGESDAIHSCRHCDVLERAVAFVVIEAAWSLLIAHEQIEKAVVVDVSPDRSLGCNGLGKACGLGYIGERSIAVISKQGRPHRRLPSAA